jgi:hypothetical protein
MENSQRGAVSGGDHSATSADLSEDQALAALQSANTTPAEIARIARSATAAKSRKVALALVMHARTPRHMSLPLLRRMFTFDLMQVTHTPAVAADVKRLAEEQIVLRLESLSAGEKTSLGRRASGRVAAELLQDADARIISAALENPQLTEALVVQALMKQRASEALFVLAGEHIKWSHRREVQWALLRSEKTPLERARRFARSFSPEYLRENLPEERSSILLENPTEPKVRSEKIC